jgi:NAD-dependent deacetylase
VVDELGRAREALEASTAVCVLTGAGISTASGIPDFRGPEGLWTKDPAAELRSTYERWMTDPELRRVTWARRVASRHERPAPNAGHLALVELELLGRLDTLVTQNIDGLHLDAGSDRSRVVEIHGTSREVVCQRCGARDPVDVVLDRVEAGDALPDCGVDLDTGRCGGILKSATISFGQSLVAGDLERSQRAAESCDLFLAVGSTLAVFPIAGIVPIARASGATVVIVNRGPTALEELADVRLEGACESLLPALVEGLSAKRSVR